MLAWAILWLNLIWPAMADESGLVEDTSPLRVEIDHHWYSLEAFTARPNHGTRFPVMVITHSSAPLQLGAGNTDPQWARTMASRGWLAVAVSRRGFGKSEGTNQSGAGWCDRPDAQGLLNHQAVDIEAALRAIGRRDDADMSRLVLMGRSMGGPVMLAVAARGKVPVSAVVDVSGGIRLWSRKDGIVACEAFEQELAESFRRMGQETRIPTLWLYGETDNTFPPDLARRYRDAFLAGGGRAEFVMFPRADWTGHGMFSNRQGQQHMLPLIDQFAENNGLPGADRDFERRVLARLNAADQPLGRQYAREIVNEKALAAADGGGRGAAWWSYNGSHQDAMRHAVSECEKWYHACHLVAVNNTLAGGSDMGVAVITPNTIAGGANIGVKVITPGQ
jgi:dienelactone hydrolase